MRPYRRDADLIISSISPGCRRTFAKALKTSPTARMPLNIGRWSQDTVHASGPALVSESFANPADQANIEASAEGCRARKAGCSRSVCPYMSVAA
jgi:hypothetical protein